MQQKQKLAIFINTLVRAGAEKVTAMLINSLHHQYDIHLLMFNASEIEFPVPPVIHIKQIGKPQSDVKNFLDVLKMPYLAYQVKRYLKKNEIPVMLSFLNRPNFISGLIKLSGWKGKSVISERTMTSTYYNYKTLGGKLGRFLVSKLYRHADMVITNSELCKIDLQETFALKNTIITINNPVNLKEIDEISKHAPCPFEKKTGEFVFCNIGRCDEFKNQELLLKAFSKVAQKNYCRLIIIGKNVPAKLLQQTISLNLSEKVILVGMQHNIFPYLLWSDCFVLSSRLEGFPNVIIEALACSKAVISTDCKSGPREILAPLTPYPNRWLSPEKAAFGILTESENADMLAEAMELLIHDPSLLKKYEQKARQRIGEYDMQIICEKFAEVIKAQYNSQVF